MKTILRLLLVGIIVVHGLIHLLGIVKGFGWAEAATLKKPIGKGGGHGLAGRRRSWSSPQV